MRIGRLRDFIAKKLPCTIKVFDICNWFAGFLIGQRFSEALELWSDQARFVRSDDVVDSADEFLHFRHWHGIAVRRHIERSHRRRPRLIRLGHNALGRRLNARRDAVGVCDWRCDLIERRAAQVLDLIRPLGKERARDRATFRRVLDDALEIPHVRCVVRGVTDRFGRCQR